MEALRTIWPPLLAFGWTLNFRAAQLWWGFAQSEVKVWNCEWVNPPPLPLPSSSYFFSLPPFSRSLSLCLSVLSPYRSFFSSAPLQSELHSAQKYKGVHFGNLTGRRGAPTVEEGPGPGHYDPHLWVWTLCYLGCIHTYSTVKGGREGERERGKRLVNVTHTTLTQPRWIQSHGYVFNKVRGSIPARRKSCKRQILERDVCNSCKSAAIMRSGFCEATLVYLFLNYSTWNRVQLCCFIVSHYVHLRLFTQRQQPPGCFWGLWLLIEVLFFIPSYSNVNTLAPCQGISRGRREWESAAWPRLLKPKHFGEDCACWKPPNPRAQICAEESSCAMKYSFDHKAGVLPCLTFLSKHFYERTQRVGPAHTVTAVSNNLLSYSPRNRLSDRGHNSRVEIKLSAWKIIW